MSSSGASAASGAGTDSSGGAGDGVWRAQTDGKAPPKQLIAARGEATSSQQTLSSSGYFSADEIPTHARQGRQLQRYGEGGERLVAG